MAYDGDDGGAYGNIPELGAIFMSNVETKKECLNRKIFALPYSHAGFVTRIKAGMVLFLFEFRNRQLFGVFQATCDGALDILPHAFNYSGKRFRAQVCFRQLWHCHPLSEREFRDAIRENYFSAKQFNFGLSVDQVQKLLYLFSSRKVNVKIPRQPGSEAIVEVAVKDRRWVGGDRHKLIERGDTAAAGYDGINNIAFSNRQVSSLARGREDFLVDDTVYAEGKVYPFPQDDFLPKERRVDSRLTSNNVAEKGLYSHSYLRTFRSESPKDSLDEVRRLANSGRSDQLDVIAHHDYTLKRKNTSSDDYNTYDGHEWAFASDHCGGSLWQRKHVINDGRFNAIKSRANSDDNLNLDRQPRDIADDHEWLMNRKLETRHHLECGDRNIRSAFGHLSRKTAAGRLQIDEDRIYPTVEERSTESMVDKFPHVLTRTAAYIANLEKQTVDERFRKIQRLDNNNESSHRHTNPVLSMEYPSLSQVDQNLSSFSDNLSHTFDLSHSTFDDATITRALPYDHPNLSTSMQKNHLHGGSLGNFYAPPSDRSEQYNLESGESRRPVDMALEFENNGFPRSSSGPQSSLLRESINSFVDPHSYIDMDLDTSAPVRYRGSLSSKLSPPCTDHENLGGEKGFLAYYSKSRDNCLTVHANICEASADLGTKNCQPETDASIYENQHRFKELHRTSAAISLLSRKSVFTRLSSKESTWLGEESNDIDIDHQDCYMDATADELMAMLEHNDNLSLIKHKKSKVVRQPRENAVDEKKIKCSMETDHSTMEKRRLKFASQTTSPREDAVGEKKIQYNMETDNSTMEKRRLKFASQTTSPREDAVGEKKIQYNMETGHSIMEKRMLRFASQATSPGENAVHEKKIQCSVVTDHATMEKRRLKFPSETTEDTMDEIPNETRILDFKRRSDRKRNLIGSGTELASLSKLAVASEEAKSSTSSTLRRRKLVRPIFSKTDFVIDATRGNETLLMPASNFDNDDKGSCKTAISLHEYEIPNITESSNVLASHTCREIDCNKGLQKDEVAHVLPSTNANGLHISEVLKETYQQKSLDIQTSSESILPKDTDIAIKEKSCDIPTSVEGVLAEVTDTTIKGTCHRKSLDIQTSGEGILPEDVHTSVKETSHQNSFDIQTSLEDDLPEVTGTTIKETSQPKSLDIQTSGLGILTEDTDNAIQEVSHKKSFDIQASVEGVLAEVTGSTIMETSQPNKLDIETFGKCILAGDIDSTIKRTSQQKGLDIQTSVEGVLAESADTTIKQTSQQKSLDIQTSGECILVENTQSAIKETSEKKSSNIQTSVEVVLSGFAHTTVKETSQLKCLGIQTSGEGNLSEVTDTAIKETSQQKSLDIQTSVKGVLAEVSGNTIIKETSRKNSLDVQTSSITTIKLGAGCANNLVEDKHLKKMKIIPPSKADA